MPAPRALWAVAVVLWACCEYASADYLDGADVAEPGEWSRDKLKELNAQTTTTSASEEVPIIAPTTRNAPKRPPEQAEPTAVQAEPNVTTKLHNSSSKTEPEDPSASKLHYITKW